MQIWHQWKFQNVTRFIVIAAYQVEIYLIVFLCMNKKHAIWFNDEIVNQDFTFLVVHEGKRLNLSVWKKNWGPLGYSTKFIIWAVFSESALNEHCCCSLLVLSYIQFSAISPRLLRRSSPILTNALETIKSNATNVIRCLKDTRWLTELVQENSKSRPNYFVKIGKQGENTDVE